MELPTSPLEISAPRKITIDDVVDQAERASKIMAEVRSRMLSPTSRKSPPIFSGAQVAQLCGIDKTQLNYRAGKGDLPAGTVRGSGRRREFTLAEVRTWVAAYRKTPGRPAGVPATVIAVGNFKGGSTKTTTAMTLAQGLSLKAYRVLLIDLDPQGSLTTLFGITPDTEVEEDDTISPLCHGEEDSVRYAIRSTYWDGLDLIPACPRLFNAEFALPARQMKGDRDFRFWDVLKDGLRDVRGDYDVIILDTPPALSYITINAFFAADGLIVPMPPSALDFASSAQFWILFSDLAKDIVRKRSVEKSFDFIHVLLSRVDMADTASSAVRKWIAACYTDKVLPVEIPKTAVTSTTSVEFGTVYDITRYEGNYKTFQRAREAYDRFVDLIEQSIIEAWAGQHAA